MRNSSSFQTEFINQTIFQLNENIPRIAKCFALLTEEEVWLRPNKASNSIGNLILHLCGNIHQYVISSLGNKPDIRDRDEEFNSQGGFSKAQLIGMLNTTLIAAISTIRNTNEMSWLKVREVQGFNFSGIGILIHVVEHLSYHVGQIAFYTKELKNKDLGFYDTLDLNIKNKE